MGKVIIIIVGIVVVLFISWIGLSIWSGACAGPANNQPDMPCKEDATHSFYIENTGGLILSSDYEQHGHEAGSRLFILHGFYEMRGNKFKFVNGDIMLNENIFGEITVKRRTKD